MAIKSNLKDILVQKISQRTTDATFSDCHSIKEKIIKCFANARLQFFAKRQQAEKGKTVKVFRSWVVQQEHADAQKCQQNKIK